MWEYEAWSRAFPPEGGRSAVDSKVAAIFIGEAGAEASLAAMGAQEDCSWVAARIPAAGDAVSFEPGALAAVLRQSAADREFVIFAPSGTILRPRAASRLAEALRAFPGANVAYCDFTSPSQDGRRWPIALTAFDYERMLEQGYGSFVFACRLEHAIRQAESGVGDLFRMFNSALDQAGPIGAAAPVHAPGFLADLPSIRMPSLSTRLALAGRAHLRARKSGAEVHAGAGRIFPAARAFPSISTTSTFAFACAREASGSCSRRMRV